MLVGLLFAVSRAVAAGPVACKDGAIIDLNVTPVVTLDGAADTAFVIGVQGAAETVDIVTLKPPGFAAPAWAFEAARYLEAKGLAPSVLKQGGYLRLRYGTDMESEFELATECLLAYDAAAVSALVAKATRAEDNEHQAMASVMICDPQGSREHAIRAKPPAEDIRIPIGPAAQGDAVMTITVSEAASYASVAEQRVVIKGGKFSSVDAGSGGIFCDAKSFDALCVKPEAVFAKTKDAAFVVSTEVDFFELVLSSCTVSR
jgi:hypothetical protein